jgi:hypothetical protein
MRENGEWRRRNNDVMDCYALKDRLTDIRNLMLERKGCPMFLCTELAHQIVTAGELTHPLTVYRDQVPREIEE